MADPATIDNQTAGIVRSALSAAQAGRIDEACEIGERGLADGGDPPTLHAMIGAFLCAATDFAGAIPHLEIAHQARPADPLIARNLATALTSCERYADVLALLGDDLVAADATESLRELRGFAAQMTGDFATAVAEFEKVVAKRPNDWEVLNNLGNSRIDAGDVSGGIDALRQAATLNPEGAPTRLNLARVLRDSGDLEGAETVFRAMAEDFPRDAVPLTDLYHLLKDQGRDEAEELLSRAVEVDPQNVELRVALGSEQLRMLKFAKAETTYRTALQLDTANGEAYFGLAVVFEHQRPDALGGLAEEAEAANIGQDHLNLVQAFAARRSRDYNKALESLGRVPEDFEPATRWHLAGQMHDSLGNADEAFAEFTKMNEANAQDPSEPVRRASELRGQLRAQLEMMTREWRSDWIAAPIASRQPAPVFIAGFPRSGTTLLDTMLMGHPDVEVMEEPPILRKLDVEFGGFDALAGLDEARVREMQDRYFELAAEHADVRRGALLIDKSPLYLQRVPQILRLFPDARFILALRNPADVLLSCFMSNFGLNSSMSNFLRLDTAAEFYDLSFSMWERALNIFAVDVHTVVYERMIEHPEAALRPVVEALGLEWRPEILDHQSTAEGRGVISTASYAQVTQPLYRGAVDRWRRYREHLEPILPLLRPWAEKFGYEI